MRPHETAIIVFGKGAGRSINVCTETNCPVHNPHIVARRAEEQAAHPEPVMAPATEHETEEEAAEREAEYERQRKEHESEQQRREEERKQQFEREQQEYEAQEKQRDEQRKTREATFERIVDNGSGWSSVPRSGVSCSVPRQP